MKYSAVLFVVLSGGALSVSMAASGPDIQIKNGSLFYDGDITKDAVARAIALYEAQSKKPTLITVRSFGGDGEAGLQFGEFIHQHALSVRVQDYCGSSCADFVFTAGKVKYLSYKSVVAWHGSAIQRSWRINKSGPAIDCDSDEACAAAIAKATVETQFKCPVEDSCDADRAKIGKQIESQFAALIKRQHAFFQSIGVDERVTVYGQDINCNCNWTFSVQDMRKFNIRNVVVDKPHFLETSFGEFRKKERLRKQVKILELPAQ